MNLDEFRKYNNYKRSRYSMYNYIVCFLIWHSLQDAILYSHSASSIRTLDVLITACLFVAKFDYLVLSMLFFTFHLDERFFDILWMILFIIAIYTNHLAGLNKWIWRLSTTEIELKKEIISLYVENLNHRINYH